MATHRQHVEKILFYYITFTCYKWMHLFEITKVYDFIAVSFAKLADAGFKNVGFVIMPNHLHFVAYAEEKSSNLNWTVGNTKRFLAYKIVERLKANQHTLILDRLRHAVAPNELKIGKKHQVFITSFDAQAIRDEKELLNILDYMHHYPVKGKWNLAEDYRLYPYSSAAFYELENPCSFPIWDYRQFV